LDDEGEAMDYQTIKKLKKERGCSYEDLIVLSAQNDPFYVGMGRQVRLAEWFADLWNKLGYAGTGGAAHIRRIHYRAISQNIKVLKPDGSPYENTENDWHALADASKYARYLGLVDYYLIEDKKNPEAIINHKLLENSPSVWVDESSSLYLSFPEFPPAPSYTLYDYEADQKYQVELWCEKSTMNDIITPLCQKYGVNYVYGTGELSLTAVYQLLKRMEATKKPCRILYVSDFDPAGMSMPVAVSRKLEFLLSKHDMAFDVRLFPVVLTFDQCGHYQLPRTPIKPTEGRATDWQNRFGDGATELDALQAIHPGELGKILEKAIRHYWDRTLDKRTKEVADKILDYLGKIQEEVTGPHKDELQKLQDEYDTVKAEFKDRISALSEDVENLYQVIESELTAKKPQLDPVPMAVEVKDDIAEPLFDSRRSYDEQLQVYKAFQRK